MKLRNRPASEMKESALEGIGGIPKKWKETKLKKIANVRVSNIDKKSYEEESEVFLCNYVDVYKNEVITSKINFMKATASAGQLRKFYLEKDDVIITKDSEEANDIAVPAIIGEQLPGVVCGYHLALIKPHRSELVGSYLLRQFQTGPINDQFVIAANGVTRFGLASSSILNAYVLAPAIDEQIQISSFINFKTAIINELIDKKKIQIELLREHEKSLIHHAVTKGLDPKAKMKDSGIEWIGKIPEDWRAIQLKNLCSEEITDGPHETPDFIDAGIPFLSVDSIQNGKLDFEDCRYISNEAHEEYKQKANPKKGDILLGKAASVGKIAMVEVDFEFSIWSPLALIRPNISKLIPKYLEFYLKSDIVQDQISILSSENTQKNIGMNKIRRIKIVTPTVTEQIEIADFLNLGRSKIENASNKIKDEIAKLEEYRKSLIYEVVTGKVEVLA